MTDDVTTIRLPHTGLNVPDRSLTLTRYKELETSDGVAFSANLRHNNKLVGLVQNHGTGGPTMLYIHDRRVFGEPQIEEYARQCRTQEGATVTVENLLDELVEEHIWARRVKDADRKKQLLLRMMDHIVNSKGPLPGFPPYPAASATGPLPQTDRQRKALAQQVVKDMPPGKHGWWQAWNGDCWYDLTTRPAGVPAELYS